MMPRSAHSSSRNTRHPVRGPLRKFPVGSSTLSKGGERGKWEAERAPRRQRDKAPPHPRGSSCGLLTRLQHGAGACTERQSHWEQGSPGFRLRCLLLQEAGELHAWDLPDSLSLPRWAQDLFSQDHSQPGAVVWGPQLKKHGPGHSLPSLTCGCIPCLLGGSQGPDPQPLCFRFDLLAQWAHLSDWELTPARPAAWAAGWAGADVSKSLGSRKPSMKGRKSVVYGGVCLAPKTFKSNLNL